MIHDERARAARTRLNYPPGTRLELVSMSDPYAPVPSGTRGSVVQVDSIGTIHMQWDNGQGLGSVVGESAKPSRKNLVPLESGELGLP